MNQIVTKYLSSKIIDDIRTKPIEEALAKELYSWKYIDGLRAELKPSDLDRLKSLAVNGSINEARLAINLLNRSCWQDAKGKPQKQIIEFLLTVWNNANEYLRRHTAMMVCLEDSQTAISMRPLFYDDLKTNINEFSQIMLEYVPNGEAGVLDFCIDRLNDRKYPVRKDWTYLCGAMASNDKDGVRKMLSKYTSTEHFNEIVAKEMLALL